MLNQPLQIESTRLSPGTLHSLTLTQGSVYIDSQAGIFQITGRGLSHLIRDLIYQQSDKIIADVPTGNTILDWRVDTVESVRRIREAGPVPSFQGKIPTGWTLYETGQRWAFFPLSTLIAIGYQSRKTGFLYGNKLVEVTSDQAKEIFESFPLKPVSGHYTVHAGSGYFDIGPATRDKVDSIRIREVNPLDGMDGFREKKVFKPLDSGHTRKRRAIDR